MNATLPPLPPERWAYCVAWYATREQLKNANEHRPTDIGIYSEPTPTSCPPRHCWPRVLWKERGADYEAARAALLEKLRACVAWVFEYPSMQRESRT